MGALCILRKIIITWVEGPQCRRDGTSRNSDGTPTQSLKKYIPNFNSSQAIELPTAYSKANKSREHKEQLHPSII
jgi:hypothetical protein